MSNPSLPCLTQGTSAVHPTPGQNLWPVRSSAGTVRARRSDLHVSLPRWSLRFGLPCKHAWNSQRPAERKYEDSDIASAAMPGKRG